MPRYRFAISNFRNSLVHLVELLPYTLNSAGSILDAVNLFIFIKILYYSMCNKIYFNRDFCNILKKYNKIYIKKFVSNGRRQTTAVSKLKKVKLKKNMYQKISFHCQNQKQSIYVRFGGALCDYTFPSGPVCENGHRIL